jgi:hypothetical protein
VSDTLNRFIQSDGLGTVAVSFKNVISDILKASWLLELCLRMRGGHIDWGFNLDGCHFRA